MVTTAGDGAGRTVLVVDDDLTVRDVVRRYLERDGHRVLLSGDGYSAVALASEADLVVLDLMLPGIDGLEVCRQLRAGPPTLARIPIIMLTALGEEEDRILGLQLGADDYVSKPFSPRELALRVSSVLRRVAQGPRVERARPAVPPSGTAAVAGQLVDGELLVDPTARRAVLRDLALSLTTREFDLLVFMLRHPGVAFSRAELLNRVWGWDFGDHSTVTVHVRRLREKIEPDPAVPSRIATVWGVGYRYDLAGGQAGPEPADLAAAGPGARLVTEDGSAPTGPRATPGQDGRGERRRRPAGPPVARAAPGGRPGHGLPPGRRERTEG
jgi:DNA-binding response OmpR family regulator